MSVQIELRSGSIGHGVLFGTFSSVISRLRVAGVSWTPFPNHVLMGGGPYSAVSLVASRRNPPTNVTETLRSAPHPSRGEGGFCMVGRGKSISVLFDYRICGQLVSITGDRSIYRQLRLRQMAGAGTGTTSVFTQTSSGVGKETCRNNLPTVYFLGGYHPSNEPFVRSPPSNVRLCSRVTAREFEEFGRLKQYSGMWPVMKKTNDALYRFIGMPRLLPVFGRYDLVHTNGSVIPLCPGPWVASIENPSAFYGFNEKWHEIPRMRRRLASFLISERCKAIMPYSDASKRYLMMGLADWREALELKTEVIPLAIDRRLIRKKPEDLQARNVSEKMRFLFVGNHFFDKGGREVLRAFRNIRDYHDSELTIVTSAPAHHSKEFQKYILKIKAERDVRFYHTGIPRSELMKLYDSSHVFVFPSYMDQVPFVFLEAMAAGLPLIGSNSYAMPEMSIDGSNGFVVESPWVAFPQFELRTVRHLADYRSAVLEEHNFDGVVESLTDKMKFLIDHEDTRLKFARESLEMVTSGRYSLGCRNKAMSAVYSRSLPRTQKWPD